MLSVSLTASVVYSRCFWALIDAASTAEAAQDGASLGRPHRSAPNRRVLRDVLENVVLASASACSLTCRHHRVRGCVTPPGSPPAAPITVNQCATAIPGNTNASDISPSARGSRKIGTRQRPRRRPASLTDAPSAAYATAVDALQGTEAASVMSDLQLSAHKAWPCARENCTSNGKVSGPASQLWRNQ